MMTPSSVFPSDLHFANRLVEMLQTGKTVIAADVLNNTFPILVTRPQNAFQIIGTKMVEYELEDTTDGKIQRTRVLEWVASDQQVLIDYILDYFGNSKMRDLYDLFYLTDRCTENVINANGPVPTFYLGLSREEAEAKTKETMGNNYIIFGKEE